MEIDENPLSKYSYDEIKRLLGTFVTDYEEMPMTGETEDPNYTPPTSFDSRT